MFKNFTTLVFILSFFLIPFALKAIEVNDLYQASVAINSQKISERPIALKQALAAVMLKVGGNKSALENDLVKRAINNYHLYLNQYRYQSKPTNNSENQGDLKQLYLFASFNEAKINQIFQQANLPLWGRLRPNLLIWLVDEQGFKRKIIANSSTSSLTSVIKEFSERRGLPMMLPLMDLTDTVQIKSSDIWGRFYHPIKEASRRYLPETILVIRISNSSLLASNAKIKKELNLNTSENIDCNYQCEDFQLMPQQFVLDWSILDWGTIEGKQTLSEQYLGADPQLLLQQGLADITDLIYQRYALTTSSQNDFVIEVANIDSLKTYAKVFEFLNDLSSVKSAKLIHVKGNSKRFKLQLLGSSEAFIASLKLNNNLSQYIDPLGYYNEPIESETSKPIIPIFNWRN